MDIIIPYHSNEEREEILKEYANLFLIEERNLIDGNFLVFSNKLPTEKKDETQLIEELIERQKLMQQALDDLIMGGF